MKEVELQLPTGDERGGTAPAAEADCKLDDTVARRDCAVAHKLVAAAALA